LLNDKLTLKLEICNNKKQKKMKKNIFISLIAIALVGMSFTLLQKVITIKGSDTMVILAQRWAEEYMSKNSGSTIQVTGGGSGVGISALINGTTDIADASRPMKMSERQQLKERFGSMGVEIKVAKDGLSVYLNESNGVNELTLAQIKDIYTGKITNWKDVGGTDTKIILYGRENSSGTYVYFKDFVLAGKDYSSMMQSLPGTAAVVNAVAKDKNGIGYGGAAYAKGCKYCKVKKDAAGTAYEPNKETVKTGDYPITRYLYMYTKTKPTGDMKKFIDWVLGEEGQALVEKVGYFPVK
jgi:phosphate transport system substrate-binding protein